MSTDRVDWAAVRHFKRHEWTTDPDRADPALVLALDAVREAAGVAVIIHEAFATTGHSPASWHYQGLAVDFHFAPGLTATEEFAVLSACRAVGGLGFYPGWRPRPGWHADLRPGLTRVFWVRENGRTLYGPGALARALGR